jgi:hypothetical protein
MRPPRFTTIVLRRRERLAPAWARADRLRGAAPWVEPPDELPPERIDVATGLLVDRRGRR